MKRIFISFLLAIMVTATTLVAPNAASAVTCSWATGRVWKLLDKAPNLYKNKNYWVYGKITEFNGVTGPNVFKADASGDNPFRQYSWQGDVSVFTGTSKMLGNFVAGDYFMACVTFNGQLSNSGLTAPILKINSILRMGGNG